MQFDIDMDFIQALLQDPFFYIGVAVGVVLLVLLVIIMEIIRFFRGRCKSLVIQEEGGVLEITDSALQSFVNSVLEKFPEVKLCKLRIIKSCCRLHLKLRVKILPNANIVEVRQSLRSYLAGELEVKLGILNKFKTVDYTITQLPSSDALETGE